MAGFTLGPATNKDRVAKTLIVNFYDANGGAYPTAARFCGAVVKSSGSNPSYIMAGIPMNGAFGPGAWDFSTGVALKSNAISGIKLLSRASAGYSEAGSDVVLCNGWVVSHGHSIKEDSIVTQIFDDRHIMASYYTCFGKMVYDPGAGKHYFLTNPEDPLIFNNYGWGDCLDTPFGPRFAPGYRYGHTGNGTTDPSDDPAPGSAQNKTRKWTIHDILRYLRDFFYETSNRPTLVQSYGLLELPKTFLDWPLTISNAIIENKTPHTFKLDNCNLLEAIVKTISYAGPYELNLEPTDQTSSQLQIIDFSNRANTGIRIFGPDYFGNNLDAIGDNPNVAMDGQIKQSALGYVDNVVLTGDAPCIEFMASTDGSDGQAFGGSLKAAWNANELTIFKARLGQGPGFSVDSGNGDASYFTFAAKESPSVFSWYKLNEAINPFFLSKYGTRTESGNYRILPHQLTSYNANATSPMGLVPREIVVEYKMNFWEYYNYQKQQAQFRFNDPAHASNYPDLGPWRVATRQNELQLSPDGRFIQFPALRDNQVAGAGFGNTLFATWYAWNPEFVANTAPGGQPDNSHYNNKAQTYGAAYVAARDIRIQLVAQSDHALAAVRGSGSDPNNTAAHIDPTAPKFSLLLRNGKMQYVDWLRRNQSWPVGIGGLPITIVAQLALQFQPKQAANSELYTDHIGDNDLTNSKNRLDTHCQKYVDNHKRICWEGTFTIGRLTPVYKIGQLITYEAQNSLPGCTGVIKCIVFDAAQQTTKLEIGPPSFSTIWDGPMALLQGGGGTSTPPTGTTPPNPYDEPYKDPDSGKTTGGGTSSGDSSSYSGSDNYDDGSKKANGAKGAEAQKAGQKAEEGKKLTPHENRMKNMQADYDKKAAAGDTAGAQRVERAMQREVDAQAKVAAKQEQLANKGSMTFNNGKTINAGDLGDAMFGKATQGSIKFESGKEIKAGQLGDAMFGKASRGSITFGEGKNAKTIEAGGLEKAISGNMFNTKAADAYSESVYKKNKEKENARMKAQNDAAEKRMGPNFHMSGKGGTGLNESKGSIKSQEGAYRPKASTAAQGPAQAAANAPAKNFDEFKKQHPVGDEKKADILQPRTATPKPKKVEEPQDE